ncbi:hypothetical protein B0O99DRAFT_562579 [Bisporella sp. PMI_857]|nr:hypothetical protein B0O99DRAFT_562579 [Bisporella sp. PMI_857]
MSASEPPKQRIRQRASTPRSKTGCITCKLRRLKCGEEKPGCVRCAKSGWKCDGYEHRSANSSSSSLLRTPSPGSYLYTPSSLDLNEQERRYFQTYIDKAPLSLYARGGDESSVFKQIMLQESNTNSCVRHAIVASGALIKSFDLDCKWAYMRRLSNVQNPHHEFALFQYQKAILELRTSIDALQSGTGARETLVSAITLAYFDFFADNGGFAIQHIHFGRKILATGRSSPLSTPFSSPQPAAGTIMDPSVTRLFMGVDIQAKFALGIDSECSYIAYVPSTNSNPLYPYQFANLDEARQFRQILVVDAYNSFLRSLGYHFTPVEEIPEEWISIREGFLQKIHLWFAAFNPLLRLYLVDSAAHPLTRPDAMRFEVTILLLRLSGMLQTPEAVYDDLTSHFEYLLGVCRDVVAYERANADYGMGIETFASEPRIIPALYLCATKCRIPSLRNEALSMLFAERRREGIWESILHGKVAQWLISLEADGEPGWGGYADFTSPTVGCDRRAWGETIQRELQSKRATVRCRQNRPAEQGGGWIERICVVEWV